jgi:hypothetical protein
LPKLPSFDVSRQQRIDIAQNAIDLLVQNVSVSKGYGITGMDCWESAHVIGGMVMAEYTAGTNRLEDDMTKLLGTVAAGLGHGDS